MASAAATAAAATPLRASKRHRRSSGGGREYLLPAIPLPDHVFRQSLVGFLDLPSSVVLAGCSRSLQSFVYENDPSRWTVIDFGTVPKRLASKVTDRALRGLLRRVDARRVTRALSLRGCTCIRGYGLDALIGARCVEELDLRLSDDHIDSVGPTGLEDSYVLSVLSCMAPICTDESKLVGSYSSPDSLGLSLVKFRRQVDTYWGHDQRMSDWQTRFREALTKAAEERETRCGHCRRVLDYHDKGICYCSCCRTYLCGYNDDCLEVVKCDKCQGQYCQHPKWFRSPKVQTKCPNGVIIAFCSCGMEQRCQDCAHGMCDGPDGCFEEFRFGCFEEPRIAAEHSGAESTP